MWLNTRRILLLLSAAVFAAGIQLLGSDFPELAWVLLASGCVSIVLLLFRPTSEFRHLVEPAEMTEIDDTRLRELIRGTSLQLREMEYRYSVRLDAVNRGSFTSDINTVRLGFVPVVITDNQTEQQGYGYVAFVHDGSRWRGPGLPCSGSPTDALEHASRCVQPLSIDEPFEDDDETKS